ncbi:T9SS type A sorting domain-containing protein [Spirosoma areae]
MTRKFILAFLLGIGSGYAAYAQDPSVGGVVVSPQSLPVGATGIVRASFGNGSSTPIPQRATATYTFTLPPNVVVTGSSVVVTSPAGSNTANLSVIVGDYDADNGLIITVRSNLGPVPGNADYTLTLTIAGIKTTSTSPPQLLVNAVATAVGTNVFSNDNANTPVVVTSGAMPGATDLSGKVTIFPGPSVVLQDVAYGVFPNPVASDGQFTVRLDEPETARVNVYSATGHLVPLQKAGIESGELLLKTQGSLSAGVYIVTVEERGHIRRHRLVVK